MKNRIGNIIEPAVKPMMYETPSSSPLYPQIRESDWWDVEGVVYYPETGKGIAAHVVVKTGNEINGEFDLDDSGSWRVWTNTPTQTTITFSAKGYQTKTIGFWELYAVNSQGEFVWLTDIPMSKAIPWGIIAAVAGAAMLYMKREKKVGFLSSADIMPIMLLVGGFIGFDLIKKTLEFLGLWDSQDTKDLDNAANNPNSFWSPNFWQTKPASTPWTYVINEATANQWIDDITDAFGWWNDSEEQAIGVFKRCRTQANLSFLAWVFGRRYDGEDLLTYLRGGWWPQDRLSDSDVNIINQYISRLPKY
jgi:hypothetical protein